MWLPKDERKVLRYLREYLLKHPVDDNVYFEYKKTTHNDRLTLERLFDRDLLSRFDLSGRESIWCARLSASGRDLADKYASRWHCSKLLYQHYLKGHPIWVLLAAILSVAGTLLAQYIYARLFPPS